MQAESVQSHVYTSKSHQVTGHGKSCMHMCIAVTALPSPEPALLLHRGSIFKMLGIETYILCSEV